jgi:hypothetical protein
VTLPELIQGPIAAEFGEEFFLRAKKKKKDPEQTCGLGCTNPKPKGITDSCPEPVKKKKAQDFEPVIQGWSEPPATRV